MKQYVIGFLLGFGVWLFILSIIPMPEEKIRFYDCGMAEWHPDIPNEVKEECRKRRLQSRGINT